MAVRTVIAILTFTLALVIIRVTVFLMQYFTVLFGIPSGNFQHKNRSADVALLPRPLSSD